MLKSFPDRPCQLFDSEMPLAFAMTCARACEPAAAKFAPRRGFAHAIFGRAVDWRKRVASLPHFLRTANQNVNFVLPILVLAIPVLAIVLIAICSGRRLAGSCGALGPDGKCARCGVAQPDVERLRAQADGRSCP